MDLPGKIRRLWSAWTRRFTVLYYALFLVWILAACSIFTETTTSTPLPILRDAFMDRSILSNTPCKAPCWYGLMLGASTKADVLTTLSSLSFINKELIQEEPYDYWKTSRKALPATWISAECKEPARTTCAGFVIVNDKLSEINLFPNHAITFLEMVNYLGPPNYIRADLIPPTGDGCQIRLFWLEQRIIVEHSEPNSNKHCYEIAHGNKIAQRNTIDPNLEIMHISYVLPENIQLTISDPNYNYPWPGFIKR